MEELKLEAIKGLNHEKIILTEALTRLSHNDAIKVARRLGQIDEEIGNITNPTKK